MDQSDETVIDIVNRITTLKKLHALYVSRDYTKRPIVHDAMIAKSKSLFNKAFNQQYRSAPSMTMREFIEYSKTLTPVDVCINWNFEGPCGFEIEAYSPMMKPCVGDLTLRISLELMSHDITKDLAIPIDVPEFKESIARFSKCLMYHQVHLIGFDRYLRFNSLSPVLDYRAIYGSQNLAIIDFNLRLIRRAECKEFYLDLGVDCIQIQNHHGCENKSRAIMRYFDELVEFEIPNYQRLVTKSDVIQFLQR